MFLLVLSVAFNMRLYVMWSSSHDGVYEVIGKSYTNNQHILLEIEKGNTSKAAEMLRSEIESAGNIIAICAIENCSKSVISIQSAKP
jgi:hypothetical protein